MLSKTPLSNLVRLEDLNPVNGKRNDGAHPPIHPVKPYQAKGLKSQVWEYIARRYLANVVGRNAVYERWKLTVSLNGVPMGASNRYFIFEGFYEIFPYFKPENLQWIPEVKTGQMLPVLDVKLKSQKTKPPPI